MEEQTQKRNNWQCILLTFSIIYLTCSMAVTGNYMSDVLTMGWWVLCGLVLLYETLFKKKFISKSLLICFATLVVVVMISTILNGENLLNQIKIVISFCVILLYVNNYSFKTIANSFTKVVLATAVISIPLYFLCLANPPFLDGFIVPGMQEGHRVYDLFIYNFDLYTTRNSGFFWEPGAFTTFLNIALILELLEFTDIKKPIVRFIWLAILIVANVLTFSTTGYLVMAVAFLIYLLTKGRSKVEKFIFAILITAIVVVILGVFSEQLFKHGGTFSKLEILFGEGSISDGSMSSATVRLYSITKPFEIFLQNPFFGVGSTKLATLTVAFTNGAITCTFVNWFAIYGIVYGVVMMAGYINLVNASNKKLFIKILIFIFLMLSIISENYAANPWFVGLALIGFKLAEEKKLRERGE